METLRESVIAGLRSGLKDARTLPRAYFAPLIALANWMYEVTERVVHNHDAQSGAANKQPARH